METYYLCYRKNSRIDWIGKLIKFTEIPRQAFVLQWRATPFGVTLESVDYKEERALKSCHTEFHHIIGAAFYKKGR